MRTTARASAKGILLPPQDPAHCVPVREIRFRIDLGSIEERGKVDSRLRDDFENFSAVEKNDLSSSWPFLSPFRGDHDRPCSSISLRTACMSSPSKYARYIRSGHTHPKVVIPGPTAWSSTIQRSLGVRPGSCARVSSCRLSRRTTSDRHTPKIARGMYQTNVRTDSRFGSTEMRKTPATTR